MLSIVGAIVMVWTVVLAWPGDAPLGLLVLLVVVVGAGGPASVIGFDFGPHLQPRPPARRSATGIINQGGFYATLFLVVAIGAGARLAHAGGRHGLPAVGVPVGDERAVPPVGARARADLALPAPYPGPDHPRAGRPEPDDWARTRDAATAVTDG